MACIFICLEVFLLLDLPTYMKCFFVLNHKLIQHSIKVYITINVCIRFLALFCHGHPCLINVVETRLNPVVVFMYNVFSQHRSILNSLHIICHPSLNIVGVSPFNHPRYTSSNLVYQSLQMLNLTFTNMPHAIRC